MSKGYDTADSGARTPLFLALNDSISLLSGQYLYSTLEAT